MQAVKSLLADLFAPLASGRLESQPAPLLASGVRLVGAYGKWLATEQPSSLEGCVRYVIGALGTPAAAEHASEAFRALCVHARKQLSGLALVRALLDACIPFLRIAEDPIERRIALTEGTQAASRARPFTSSPLTVYDITSCHCGRVRGGTE